MVAITIEQIKTLPEADLIVNHIVDRRRKGLYSLTLVHGLPGTGKSSTCFRLVELTKEVFKDRLEVKTKLIESLKDLASFAMEAQEDKLEMGIIEELSTLFPSRRSMAGDNVDVGKILDTCRKKKVILFANAPIWISIDSHIRMMANVYLETIKVYKKAGVVVSRFYRLQTNPQTGKTYTHSFQRSGKEVTKTYTRMPNLEVWKDYEIKKDELMKQLYIKILKRAEKREEKENKELGIAPKLTPVLTRLELEYYDKYYNKKWTQGQLAKHYGVSSALTCQKLRKIREKLNISKENWQTNVKRANQEPIK